MTMATNSYNPVQSQSVKSATYPAISGSFQTFSLQVQTMKFWMSFLLLLMTLYLDGWETPPRVVLNSSFVTIIMGTARSTLHLIYIYLHCTMLVL
jgi:hypothetical protein